MEHPTPRFNKYHGDHPITEQGLRALVQEILEELFESEWELHRSKQEIATLSRWKEQASEILHKKQP